MRDKENRCRTLLDSKNGVEPGCRERRESSNGCILNWKADDGEVRVER